MQEIPPSTGFLILTSGGPEKINGGNQRAATANFRVARREYRVMPAQKGSRALIAGVGMIPFMKPGASEDFDVMGAKAASDALKDAGINISDVQQAYVGYVYGDSTCGQKAIYRLGKMGMPIINVNNNCSTGSTALFLARQAVESGAADCVLALGFEQMKPGALGTYFDDRPSPFDDFNELCNELMGPSDVPSALRCFGGAGQSHMEKYGTTLEDFAKVRAKASRHAAKNPLALLRTEMTSDDVLASTEFWPGVMTKLMACPPTCGAAAALVVSESYARKHGLSANVAIAAQAMTTDTPETFAGLDMMLVAGYGMTRDASRQVYNAAGIGPEDVDVVELHDCFAHNELITYEGLGLCGEGEAQKFIADGDNTYGGRFVTNPSGGLLSKGHPLGATGLAQCYELTHQLRGTADARQVEGAEIALQHNIGLGGACVVTLYQKTG
jgi:sterol carrier protein 2|nr:lipid-transfer protein [Henriciella sp.]